MGRTDHRMILLLGKLNIGKTVLFNRLCGRRLKVANYPGTSVSIGRGSFSEAGEEFRLADTPGINSMIPESEDEVISRDILLEENPDIIAQIADGKNLRRSLLLTLQLAEYGTPLVLDLNMMDEARQRGIAIDQRSLSSILGVPVTKTVATEGEGVGAFRRALPEATIPKMLVQYPERIEAAIAAISDLVKDSDLPPRVAGVALLSGDQHVKELILKKCPITEESLETLLGETQAHFNRPLGTIMVEARLNAVDRIMQEVQTVSPPARMPFSARIGAWTRSLPTGIPIAALVVFLMYLFVGKFGATLLVDEVFMGRLFDEGIIPLTESVISRVPSPLVQEAVVGEFGLVSTGLALAFGVVLPVLLTFFLAFGVLEDSGYLPRLSVLLDRLFRKIGLNGKGVLPLVMGFSCITMAILTTRVLDTKKERYIATLLLILGLPCAPLLGVMLVILGKLSIWATVVVFGVIAAQIIIVGFLLDKIVPGLHSDFILELPPMRIPKPGSLFKKTGWRIWWFTREAIPLFLIATFILFVLEQLGLLALLEKGGEPILTGFLELPAQSIKLVIGTLIRREYGAGLLADYSEAGMFDSIQVVVAMLVMTFLSPCVNAILMIIKERGVKAMLTIMAFVTPYAILVGAVVNWICRTLGVSFS